MLIVPFSGCFVKILLYITDDFIVIRCSPARSCSAGQAAGGRGAPGLKGRPAPAGRAGAATWGECGGGAGGPWLGAGCPEVARAQVSLGRGHATPADGFPMPGGSGIGRRPRDSEPSEAQPRPLAHRPHTHTDWEPTPEAESCLQNLTAVSRGGGSRREGPQRVGRGSRGRWLDTATRPTRGVGSRWVPLDARANFAILGPPSG